MFTSFLELAERAPERLSNLTIPESVRKNELQFDSVNLLIPERESGTLARVTACMNNRILILYAKSGFLGHKVIADNYGSLLRKLGYEVQVEDVFKIEQKAQIRIGNEIYFILIKNFGWLWRFLYHHWTYFPGMNWIRTCLLPRRFKKTQRLVSDFEANVIVTTHPIATSVVSYLKAQGQLKADLFTVFSDWHTQSFWAFPRVDKYFVATPQHKVDLVRLGFRTDQVEVTGILLADNFYTGHSKQEARRYLNLPLDKKVILVMGGGQGWKLEEVMSSLTQLGVNAHFVVMGGNPERKKQLEDFIRNHPFGHGNYRVTGFVDSAPYFAAADLVISKPGGLTTSEAFLSKVPLFVFSPLPGQEDENVRILADSDSILLPTQGLELAKEIDNLLSDQKRLDEVTKSAFRLMLTDTRQNISNIFRITTRL